MENPCPETSPSRLQSHPDITLVCHALSSRCCREAVDGSGILMKPVFHCNKPTGYFKRPHRESFRPVKDLQREKPSLVSCPSPRSYKCRVCVRVSCHGRDLCFTEPSRWSAERMADILQNALGTPAVQREDPGAKWGRPVWCLGKQVITTGHGGLQGSIEHPH